MMEHVSPDDAVPTVHATKEKIHLLTQEQSAALQAAVYFGMTDNEAKEYDKRRTQILELINRLAAFEKAH